MEDMLRKIKSEDMLQERTDIERRKRRKQRGLETLVVYEVKDAYKDEREKGEYAT